MIETTVCPVLAFTPDVEHALRWFWATHELAGGPGHYWWRRAGLPGPGTVGEQDAQLMEALDLLRLVHDDLIRPRGHAKDVEEL